jgi:NAD(P)-dependent dehydrogenase (short-subunit alcohol dehydrogenase family)
VLHNNVGIVEVGGPVEITEENWDRVHEVNLKNMLLACEHVLRHLCSIRRLGVLYTTPLRGD